ncbi:MAG: hypothetical protein GTO08_08385 [Deltaproteobacteria bacterium]|nr:hypothetical protein [Deltaproteobacteria bacterium]
MKKVFFGFALMTFLFFSVISHSNMGEKHEGAGHSEAKDHQEEMKEHHGEMEEHHGKMEVLHHSMEIFEDHTDRVLDLILSSHFADLEESARGMKKLADGLEGTKPHKNLKNIDKYNSLVSDLKKGIGEFEDAIKGKDPLEITDDFGKLINICVECHISFRD